MNESNWTERTKAAGIVMLIFVALPSVALHSYLGLNVKVLFQATTLIIFLSRTKNIRYEDSGRLPLVLALVSVITAIAWLWSTLWSQLLLGITLLTLIGLTWLTTRTLFNQQSVNLLYRFAVLVLVGAWIGFFYSMSGGGPTYCFENPDGRQNCLYLATFSNSDTVASLGAIRPAGIFDEPGALSFFTILVVCLNELCNGGRTKSLVLFSLGLITLSMAHLICFATYVAIAFRRRIAYLAFALVVLAEPIGGLLGNYLADSSPLMAQFLGRFSIENEQLSGDNRTPQMIEFFSLVNYDITRYGNNAMSKYDKGAISAVDQSSNPFSIWFGYGLIMWIPYVLIVAVLSLNAFRRKRSVQITAVLLVLLLLQRPYIYSLYWGFAIWSVVALMFVRNTSQEETSI